MKICKTKILFLHALCAVFFCATFFIVSALTVNAQDAQTETLTARKGRGRRDKNIGKPKKKYPTRGEAETVCKIEIKNTTPFRVSVYVNDYYRGLVESGSSFKLTDDIGRIKVYTRTSQTQYNYNYWGPSYFNCGNEKKSGSVFLNIANYKR